jgi:polynucleotide 5'-hydroxyl-kinase GRC3/NOL9
MDITQSWEQLSTNGLRGVLMVIGAPDVGKSTFARYLYGRLCAEGLIAAFLDGDPGQSSLGPPTTLTLAMSAKGDQAFPPAGRLWRRFVGAVSPRGHMLPLLVGAARLAEAGRGAGAEAIVYDTSGLVDPAQGGVNLKLAKIELLGPAAVFAIQREEELEPLLTPLRRSRRALLIELQPSKAVQPRDLPTRQAHRAEQFARYFAAARLLAVDCGRLAVFPAPHFVFNRLVALEDARGFTLGLGIVRSADLKAGQVTLLTPLAALDGVDALRLGDLTLDPRTWRDQRVGE